MARLILIGVLLLSCSHVSSYLKRPNIIPAKTKAATGRSATAAPVIVAAANTHRYTQIQLFCSTPNTAPSFPASEIPTADDLILYNEDTISRYMTEFKSWQGIEKVVVMKILADAIEVYKRLPNVLSIKRTESITVCGDTHGQYNDFVRIFDIAGMPSDRSTFVFNGDMVDRGPQSMEIVLILCLFMLASKNNSACYMVKGNHETFTMNSRYGFQNEVLIKQDSEVLERFRELFAVLPVAAVLEDLNVFVVHGGLGPVTGNMTIADLNSLDRTVEPSSQSPIAELLWSDARDGLDGFAFNSNRGGGYIFGPKISEEFLCRNGLELMIRSHEVMMDGYSVLHGGRCMTVFSAPNYCGQVGNRAAVVRFDERHDQRRPLVLSYTAAADGAPFAEEVRSIELRLR